jgi:hypothetical protein
MLESLGQIEPDGCSSGLNYAGGSKRLNGLLRLAKRAQDATHIHMGKCKAGQAFDNLLQQRHGLGMTSLLMDRNREQTQGIRVVGANLQVAPQRRLGDVWALLLQGRLRLGK